MIGKDDYDQLSELGVAQAKLLGQHWQTMAPVDAIFCGQLRRHQQTLEHFLLAAQLSSHQAVITPGFNEFDHQDILSQYQPDWRQQLKAELSHQQLEQLLLAALARWTSGKYDSDYRQSWSEFKQTCIDGLKQLLTTKQNQMIFTSAGVISVLLQHISQFSDRQVFVTAAQLCNSSVTCLQFDGEKLAIVQQNNHTHLPSDLVTHK